MKLFFLSREQQQSPFYDCANSFVVRAENETAARMLAALRCGDEEERTWIRPALSTCTELLPEGEEEVICRDYHHG